MSRTISGDELGKPRPLTRISESNRQPKRSWEFTGESLHRPKLQAALLLANRTKPNELLDHGSIIVFAGVMDLSELGF